MRTVKPISLPEWIVSVNPIVVYPTCYQENKLQDCFQCPERGRCESPRGLCVRQYYGHKNGCPNYGKKEGCPPEAPMFYDVYDEGRICYAVYNVFNLGAHVEQMRVKHPEWTERQLRNCLYWQPTARRELRHRAELFRSARPELSICYIPEAMGVNVTETMRRVGIDLQWPPETIAYQIALAAIRKTA